MVHRPRSRGVTGPLTIDDIFARGDVAELRARLSGARPLEAFQWFIRAERERQPALAAACRAMIQRRPKWGG